MAGLVSPQKQVAITRQPETDLELWIWLKAVLGVQIPRISVCSGHSAPFTAFTDAYFARHSVSIWKGSRGLAGKSYMLATLGLSEAIALGASVRVLGGSAAQSLNVHEHMTDMWLWPNAPRHLQMKEPTKYETKLLNGAVIRALLASSRSVRGPHPQRLRLDEIDEMELTILNSAMGMPMSDRKKGIKASTVMSSTHQYPDGTMTAQMNEAKAKGWPIHSWCHIESSNPVDGWLSQETIDEKRNDVSREMWRVEYELGEPAIEGRAFDTVAVQRMYDRNKGNFTGTRGKEYIFQLPETNAIYVTGVDWGRKRDFTVIDTWKIPRTGPWERVAWMRVNKEAWPKMVGRVVKRWRAYPGYIAHDATGLGDVVGSLFPEALRADEWIEDIVMVGSTRASLFSELIAGVEEGSFTSPYIEWAHDEMIYTTEDDLFRAGVTFHPPDSVVAQSLAWYLRSKQHRPVTPEYESLTGESGWTLDVNFEEEIEETHQARDLEWVAR